MCSACARQVLPLSLNVSVRAALRLQQGSTVAALSGDNFQVATNGRRDAVQYNVTRPPRHGGVFMAKDVPALAFSQVRSAQYCTAASS